VPGFIGGEPRPNDPCFCDSGQIALRCCRATGDWRPPSGGDGRDWNRGYSHPKCYVGPLSGCGLEIEREHYISESVLKALGDGLLEVNGMPWQSGAPTSFDRKPPRAHPVRSAQSVAEPSRQTRRTILSDRASRREGPHRAYPQAEAPSWSVFNGHDLERWLLKTLLGMLAAKCLMDGGEPLLGGTDVATLNVLFGTSSWPTHCGI
jgi:hypothetical protein